MKLDSILVPLDGSPLGGRALPYAAHLARAGRGRLVLVRAAEGASDEQAGERDLTGAAESLPWRDVPVETHVRQGAPADVILEAAGTWGAGCIAMSTHGRSGLGRVIFGSVADAVLRRARVPVLLVSAHCERRWGDRPPEPLGRVLVPLDGSELGETALEPAQDLASVLGEGLLLVQVLPLPVAGYGYPMPYLDPATFDAQLDGAKTYLEGVAGPLRAAGKDVAVETALGDPAGGIARLAREWDVDAIAMATHGRTGLARVVLGNTATGVVQLATTPILVERPPTLGEG
jgi:nucleotide-binding universal stress UspA family protein